MIVPIFPYTGSQIIHTSDRVMLHSRTDGVFIFGKATVGLSSPSTINLDSNEGVKIDSPVVELGHDAMNSGEQVVLGNTLSAFLNELIDSLTLLSTTLSQADGTNQNSVAASFSAIKIAGDKLAKAADNLKKMITPGQEEILSDVTYTT